MIPSCGDLLSNPLRSAQRLICGFYRPKMAHLEGFEPPTPSSEDWLYGVPPLFADSRMRPSLACVSQKTC